MKWDPAFYRNMVDKIDEGVYFVDTNRNITYWNQSAERLSGFRAATVLGRHCGAGVLEHVNECGRQLCSNGCPLSAAMTDGQPHSARVWLRHADGSRVPVEVQTAPMHDEQGKVIGAAQIFSDDPATLAARGELAERADTTMIDPDTGLGNRRYLMTELQTIFEEWDREGEPFGVLSVDVSGPQLPASAHSDPDSQRRAVHVVGRTLSHGLSASAVAARYDDRIFLVLQRHSDQKLLTSTAGRLHMMFEASRLIVEAAAHRITTGVGGTLVIPGDSPERVLSRATKTLEIVRDSGRNPVIINLSEPATVD